jgi:hypothetical protein
MKKYSKRDKWTVNKCLRWNWSLRNRPEGSGCTRQVHLAHLRTTWKTSLMCSEKMPISAETKINYFYHLEKPQGHNEMRVASPLQPRKLE